MRDFLLVSLTAVRAETPEGDIRLVHQVSGVTGGFEARCLADHAVDVGEAAAVSADEMVMVVADPALEASRASRGFDPSYEPRRGERVQRLVDGLERHVTEPIAYLRGDRVDVEMVSGAYGIEDGEPCGRHPEPSGAQVSDRIVPVVRVLHALTVTTLT
jgi:hypothetical protein